MMPGQEIIYLSGKKKGNIILDMDWLIGYTTNILPIKIEKCIKISWIGN